MSLATAAGLAGMSLATAAGLAATALAVGSTTVMARGGAGQGLGVGSLRLQPAKPAKRASPASKGSTDRGLWSNMRR
jgi:hypothetical protein